MPLKPGRKPAGPSLVDKITTGASKNESAIKLKAQHDREFDLCAGDLFYFLQFCQTEDEDNKAVRPFPTHYEYLRRENKSIEDHQKTVFLKSRRLLMSWLGMLRQMHQGMFAGSPCGHEIFSGGIGSIGQTEAEYLITRITRVYHRLPEWLKARAPLITDNKMYMEWERGGKVQAFPCKREGPQTFGFSEFFFDEIALQEAARTTWTGLIPTLGANGKVVAVSTPNGKGNFFYKLWSNENNMFGGINRRTIHWTENPEHDMEWFKKATEGMDRQMIERMFELSFAVYAGQPVWDKFERQTHVWDVEKEGALTVQDGMPVYHGWDFGYHSPAWTLWQKNSKDQWQVIDELQGYDIEFEDFCTKVRERCISLYNRKNTPEIMCIPPDGLKRSSRSGTSGAVNDWQDIENVFKQYGKRPKRLVCPPEVGTRTNEAPRLKETRKLFALRADGRPGLIMNSTCEGFIEGCAGGYCYPENGDTEQPAKNESSHLQDAGQSVFSATARVMMTQSNKQPTEKRPRISRAGYKVGI